MVNFEAGFDVTERGVSFIARIDRQILACWVSSDALREMEGLEAANISSLRKAFKRHEKLIKERIAQKIAQGAAEPDRTYSLHSGELQTCTG